ncbi:unnamed protein product [Pedinophyceae sp. YPF-701]|nr:unnamed protein product [Pedinophyceae sp. YPF-701]
MLLFDRRLRDAVCPERKRGGDSALSGMASVTEVVLSGDLQVAKVYISILSDQEGKEVAMENLRKLQPYVRMRVGKSLRLRLTPEIRLIPDESIERAMRVLKLLDQIKEGDDGATAREPPPIAIPGDDEEGGFFDMYEDEDSFDEEYAEFEGPTNLFDEEGGESVESGGGFVGSAAGGEDDDEEDQEARALDDIFKSYREQRRQAQVGGYSRPVPARRTEEEVIPEKFGGASLQEVSGGGVLDVADLAELDDLDVSQRKPWSRKRGSWNRNRTGGGGGGGGGRRRRR